MASKKMSDVRKMISEEQIIAVFLDPPKSQSEIKLHKFIKQHSTMDLGVSVKNEKQRDVTMNLVGKPKRIITRNMLSFLDNADDIAQAVRQSSNMNYMNTVSITVPTNQKKPKQGKVQKNRNTKPAKKKFHSAHATSKVKRKSQAKKIVFINPKKIAVKKVKRVRSEASSDAVKKAKKVHSEASSDAVKKAKRVHSETSSDAGSITTRNDSAMDITESPVVKDRITRSLATDPGPSLDMSTNKDQSATPITIPVEVGVNKDHLKSGVSSAVQKKKSMDTSTYAALRKGSIVPQNPFAAVQEPICVEKPPGAELPVAIKKSDGYEKKNSWFKNLFSPIVNQFSSKKDENEENQ